MIATVTLNPALDVTITIDRFRQGETHRTPAAMVRAGGKGVNVARALRGQDIDATVIAFAGRGIAGEEFARDLAHARLDSLLVWTDISTRVSHCIHEVGPGRATLFNEVGLHPGESALTQLVDSVSRLRGLSCLVIAGSLPAGVEPETISTLVARGHARGVPVIVDAGGPALLAAAEAGATVVKANESELRQTIPEAESIAAAAVALLSAGAQAVVLTRGEKGMLAFHSDGIESARLRRALVGNPTGAGDAASAALANSLSQKNGFDRLMLVEAVAWSAGAVLAPFAGEIHPSWVQLVAEVETEHSRLGEAIEWS